MASMNYFLNNKDCSTLSIMVYNVCIMIVSSLNVFKRGCHGQDRMVVGFTTTFAISAYHH
jgi:hypothetical protein